MQVFVIELSTPDGIPQIVQDVEIPDPIETIEAKPRTGPQYGVQFMRDGVRELLPAGAKLSYTVKKASDLTSTTALVSATDTDWTTPGTTAGFYLATVSYNSSPLITALALNPVPALVGVFSWRVGTAEPLETAAVAVLMLPRVKNYDETGPTPGGPDLDGRITNLEEGRFSTPVTINAGNETFTGNLLDLQVDEASKFRVDETGFATLRGISILKTAVKAADLTRTSNVTAAADPDLQFAIGAGEKWSFRFTVYFASTAPGSAPGFKFGLSGPASPSGLHWEPAAGLTRYTNTLTGISVQLTYTTLTAGVSGSSGAINCCLIEGLVENGATAGSVAFTWAQASTSTTGVTIKAGSHLQAHRLA